MGYEYAERSPCWEGERLTVDEVEAADSGGKRSPHGDGRRFELFYGELYDEWRIHPIGNQSGEPMSDASVKPVDTPTHAHRICLARLPT